MRQLLPIGCIVHVWMNNRKSESFFPFWLAFFQFQMRPRISPWCELPATLPGFSSTNVFCYHFLDASSHLRYFPPTHAGMRHPASSIHLASSHLTRMRPYAPDVSLLLRYILASPNDASYFFFFVLPCLSFKMRPCISDAPLHPRCLLTRATASHNLSPVFCFFFPCFSF